MLVRADQPSPFARSRIHVIHPSSGPLAGKRKVTFMVAPAGTTFGVADPTSRSTPSSPSATNSVAGSELRLSTVTVQLRAFGGTGPTAGGSSGRDRGRAREDRRGRAREGWQRRQRHAGRDVQLRRARRNTLTVVVTVAATRHEDRAVEQERERGAVAAPEHGRGGRQRPGPWVVQAAAVQSSRTPPLIVDGLSPARCRPTAAPLGRRMLGRQASAVQVPVAGSYTSDPHS